MVFIAISQPDSYDKNQQRGIQMQFKDEGYIAAIRRYGENSLIVNVITKEHGLIGGFVKGGGSKKNAGIYQPGNRIFVDAYARIEENMLSLKTELLAPTAVSFMNSPPPTRGARQSRPRPDAAAGSDLFEDRNLDPHGFFVCPEQCHHRRGNHVVLVFGGKFLPAAVADNEPPGTFFDADLQQVAHAVERQPHHIEAATQVRHRSRGENFDISHDKISF